jgi:hypothetical protein
MKALLTPIKRSKQLAQLSREHHETLLFAWKLIQGKKYGTSNEILMAYCQWFSENHLINHFKKEEQAFSNVISMDHPLMVKMLEDHEAIKMKLKVLAECPTYDGFERLAQIIIYHVQFEERELFKYIEQISNEKQLDSIYMSLINEKSNYPAWTHWFWIKPTQN